MVLVCMVCMVLVCMVLVCMVVMVLEWVPSMGQLARVAPAASQMSAEQQERLDAALALLDTRGDGTYGREELRQVLRACEHEEPDEATLDAILRDLAPAAAAASWGGDKKPASSYGCGVGAGAE